MQSISVSGPATPQNGHSHCASSASSALQATTKFVQTSQCSTQSTLRLHLARALVGYAHWLASPQQQAMSHTHLVENACEWQEIADAGMYNVHIKKLQHTVRLCVYCVCCVLISGVAAEFTEAFPVSCKTVKARQLTCHACGPWPQSCACRQG